MKKIPLLYLQITDDFYRENSKITERKIDSIEGIVEFSEITLEGYRNGLFDTDITKTDVQLELRIKDNPYKFEFSTVQTLIPRGTHVRLYSNDERITSIELKKGRFYDMFPVSKPDYTIILDGIQVFNENGELAFQIKNGEKIHQTVKETYIFK